MPNQLVTVNMVVTIEILIKLESYN